jgi:hypothetical protein
MSIPAVYVIHVIDLFRKFSKVEGGAGGKVEGGSNMSS